MSSGSSGLAGSNLPKAGLPGSGIPRKRIRLRPRDVLFLVVVAAGAVFLSVPHLFSPWVYFTGGSFHLMPWWSGAGSFTGPDGEYQIYLDLKPADEGSHPSRTTHLVGDGHLCTPAGERLIISISADMDRHLQADTVGKSIEIDTFTRNKPSNFGPMVMPGSPYLRLNGTWGVGKIEATGTMGHEAGGPAPVTPVPIAVTLERASDWWAPKCAVR